MGKRKEAGKDPKVANTSKISTTADAKDDRVASSNSTAEKKKLQQKQKKPKKGWLATIFDASTKALTMRILMSMLSNVAMGLAGPDCCTI